MFPQTGCMRRLSTIPLILSTICTACFTAESGTDQVDELALQARPYAFAFARDLSYDEDGSLRYVNDRSSLRLSFDLPTTVNITGFAGITIDECTYVDAAGNSKPLALHPGHDLAEEQKRFSSYELRRGAFSITIPVETPPFAAQALGLVNGHLTLHVEAGEPRSLPLKPVKDWVGKRLAVKDLGNGRVWLGANKDKLVSIHMASNLKEMLKSISFSTAAGIAIGHHSSSSSRGQDGVYELKYRLDRALPEDGAIQLVFFGETREGTGTFTVQNIPLRKAAISTEVTAVELKPLPAKPEPEPERLIELQTEVQVEAVEPDDGEEVPFVEE